MPTLWMRRLRLGVVRLLLQEQMAGKWQSCIAPGPCGTVVGRHSGPMKKTGSPNKGQRVSKHGGAL